MLQGGIGGHPNIARHCEKHSCRAAHLRARRNSTARCEIQGAPRTPRTGPGGLRGVHPEKGADAVVTDQPKWQTAMQALLLVVEQNGPTMFARIGVMQALNRNVKRVFNPDRKDPHWGKRKLARDR